MGFRLTRRVPGFALAAFLVYALATNTEVVWLYLVAAMLLALTPLGVAGPWLALHRLRLEVPGALREGFLPPLAADGAKVFSGDSVTLRLRSSRPSHGLEIVAVRLRPGGLVPVQRVVGFGDELHATFDAPARGIYEVEAVQVGSTWPVGFAIARAEVRIQHPLQVFPRYWIQPRQASQGVAGGLTESRRRGMGEQPFGLREYRAGDSQRRIHWPTSARTGSLMVAEPEAELDSHDSFTIATTAGAAAEAVELAASIAASLCAGASQQGADFSLTGAGPRPSHSWAAAHAALAAWAGRGAGSSGGGRQTRVEATSTAVLVKRGSSELRLPLGTSLGEAERLMAGLP